MSKRRARLNEQLRRELSDLIRKQVRDPRVGLVTITGVDIAADLGSARVYVRVTGSAEEIEQNLEGLGAAAPFLRTTLGRILHIRRVPELRFQEDRSYSGAARIEQVLSEVLPDDQDEKGVESEPLSHVDAEESDEEEGVSS